MSEPAPSLLSLLERALADAGALLPVAEYASRHGNATLAGMALLPHALSPGRATAGTTTAASFDVTARPLALAAAADSLAMERSHLARILGLGHQLADGLAALVATPAAARSEVARLGALFNLGIALFDRLCDRHPARAARLLEQITPAALATLVAGADRTGAFAATNDAGVDGLLLLIADFFAGVHRLPGRGPRRAELSGLMARMYRAELLATRAHRATVAPSRDVLRQLRRKSAAPMRAMALIAALGHAGHHASASLAARDTALVQLAGEALWIIDDLVDLDEDFAQGVWSRPLWLLAQPGSSPAFAALDAEHARAAMLTSSITRDECQRLARRLRQLLCAPSHARPFAAAVQLVVQSWVHAIVRRGP